MLKHYTDLSSYSNEISFAINEVKNIGWLSKNHEFTTGETEQDFIDKLKKIASPQNDIPKGDYGYFTMGDQSKFNVKVKIDQPKNKTEHLVYYLNSNSSNLKDLVEEFRNAAFEVKFYTSDGKIF